MNKSVSLSQKYRPLKFKDVLGQESIITVLKNILKNKKFSVPLMFTGFYGCGKTTLARIFARAALCDNITEDQEPCNECPSCKSFLEDSNLAYNEIDAATNSGVDKIRQIREESNFKSLSNNQYRVVVIDESHSISQQGNEALLKQLEDNSNKQIYIFCTTSPDKMLKTVRSRCFEFNLNKTSSSLIKEKLEIICDLESIRFESGVLEIISEETFPHVRDAIKHLDFLSNYGYISKDIVFNYFKHNHKTNYLKILLNLKDNLKESLSILDQVYAEKSVTDIYEGLIETALDCQKIKLEINNFKNKEQMLLGSDIIKIYQEQLNTIIDTLISRNRYSDFMVIQSDLISLSYKLGNEKLNKNVEYILEKFPKIETEEIIVDKKSEQKSSEDVIMENENNDKKLEKEQVKDGEELEETTKILKRYQAYPQSLALLMDKGKKSSSIKNRSTVELNKGIKDFKRNLDKEEISNFLKAKKVST